MIKSRQKVPPNVLSLLFITVLVGAQPEVKLTDVTTSSSTVLKAFDGQSDSRIQILETNQSPELNVVRENRPRTNDVSASITKVTSVAELSGKTNITHSKLSVTTPSVDVLVFSEVPSPPHTGLVPEPLAVKVTSTTATQSEQLNISSQHSVTGPSEKKVIINETRNPLDSLTPPLTGLVPEGTAAKVIPSTEILSGQLNNNNTNLSDIDPTTEKAVVNEIRPALDSMTPPLTGLVPEEAAAAKVTSSTATLSGQLNITSHLPDNGPLTEKIVADEIRLRLDSLTPPLTGLVPEGTAVKVTSPTATLSGQVNANSSYLPVSEIVIDEIRPPLDSVTPSLTGLVPEGVAQVTFLPHAAIDDNEQQTKDIPVVDLRNKYNSVDTKYCADKRSCQSDVFGRTCYCDWICDILGDCCEDADIVQDVHLTADQFTCTRLPSITQSKEIMVVTKCAPNWTDEDTRKLCETYDVPENTITKVLVSDKTNTSVTYKNMHCAYCNYVYEFEFWQASISCLYQVISDKLDYLANSSNCHLTLQTPKGANTLLECRQNENVVSNCGSELHDKEIIQKCTSGTFSTVYSLTGEIYRNKYCAVCNGKAVDNLYCEPYKTVFFSHGVERAGAPTVYSFRMLVDFNSQWMHSGNNEVNQNFRTCKYNEFYDPFSDTCREMRCPPSTVPIQQKCSPVYENLVHSHVENSTGWNSSSDVFGSVDKNFTTDGKNCSWAELKKHEFEVDNVTHSIMFQGKIYNKSEYVRHSSSVFLCIHAGESDNIRQSKNMHQFNEVESYLSLIGLIISIVSLLVTLAIYIILPALRNLPGKILIGLIVSLLLAQLLYLIAAETVYVHAACKAVAILMHFLFLSSFSWMNILAFNLWMTFSQKVIVRTHNKHTRRILLYSTYAVGIPLIIVLLSVIVNFTTENDHILRPGYGEGTCWFTSKFALLLFFAGPLALFKAFDFIAFGVTLYHIAKAKRQGAMARERKISSFFINIKLSLTMGLTWTFAFIANFTNSTVVWYFFIVFNTLQGLFIALSFLCTKRTLRLLKEKKMRTLSSIGTHTTTISSNG